MWRSHKTVLYSSATRSGTVGTQRQTRSTTFGVRGSGAHDRSTVLQRATCSPPCSGQTGSPPGSATSALKTMAMPARPFTCTASMRSGLTSTVGTGDSDGTGADVHAEFTPPKEHLAFVPKEPGEMDLTGIFSDPLPVVVELLTKYTDYRDV